MALAGEVDAREVLVERDRDVRVGLVVAQPDVEARLVLADEVLLGEQRLGLGLDDERPRSWSISGEQLAPAVARASGEVRGDALADRLRLADVDRPGPWRRGTGRRPGLVGERAALFGEAVAVGYRHPAEDREVRGHWLRPPRRRVRRVERVNLYSRHADAARPRRCATRCRGGGRRRAAPRSIRP